MCVICNFCSFFPLGSPRTYLQHSVVFNVIFFLLNDNHSVFQVFQRGLVCCGWDWGHPITDSS